MLTDFNVALGLVHKIGQKKKYKNSAPFYILIWLDAFYYLIFFFSLAKVYSKKFRSIIFAIRLEAFLCYLWEFVSVSIQWTVEIIMLTQSCKACKEAVQIQLSQSLHPVALDSDDKNEWMDK